MRTLSTIAVCVVSALSVVGCGGSPTSPSGTSGNFRMMMKDAPYDDAKAVLVTFTAVEVHRAGGPPTRLNFAGGGSTRTCDLKKLEAAQDLIGTASLETGQYTMIRFEVQSATVYFDNPSSGAPCQPSIEPPAGRSEAAHVASGEMRINRNFDVQANGETTMLVDFDGRQSLTGSVLGRLVLTPVIVVVSVDAR
jgi:hypothetical protein